MGSKNTSSDSRLEKVAKDFNQGSDDVSKRLNDLRKFLLKLPGMDGRALAAVLPGKGYWALRLESSRIVLR